MASDRSSGGRAASRSARIACAQPRTPPGRQTAPAASTVGAPQLAESALHVLLGCAADPRWVTGCAFSSAQPRLSADGSRLH
eukprot:2931604-Prymnesium_polylepis.1